MEEAQALCDRITIMVQGELKCLGTIPHVLQKYGDGYQLDLTLNLAGLSDIDLIYNSPDADAGDDDDDDGGGKSASNDSKSTSDDSKSANGGGKSTVQSS